MTQHNQKAEIQQAVQDTHQLMNSDELPHCNPEEMITLTDIVSENSVQSGNVHKLYAVIHRLLEQLEKVVTRNNNADYRPMIEELREELKDFIKIEIKRQLLALLKK